MDRIRREKIDRQIAALSPFQAPAAEWTFSLSAQARTLRGIEAVLGGPTSSIRRLGYGA